VIPNSVRIIKEVTGKSPLPLPLTTSDATEKRAGVGGTVRAVVRPLFRFDPTLSRAPPGGRFSDPVAD
jgi:hypothetical protein